MTVCARGTRTDAEQVQELWRHITDQGEHLVLEVEAEAVIKVVRRRSRDGGRALW
jgi:hypothetical protein